MSSTYEIKVLDLMDVDVQRGFLVLARVPVEHRFTSETHEPGHGAAEWLPPPS